MMLLHNSPEATAIGLKEKDLLCFCANAACLKLRTYSP